MRISFVIAIAIGLIAAPAAATAQDEAPATLRLSFFRCDQSGLADMMAQIEALDMPIWEELVDEGSIQSHGHFVHSWASEWNFGIYTIADDIPAVLDAVEEFGRRFGDRNPNAVDLLGQACPEHRDGFYTFGPRTAQDDDGS